MKKVFAFVLCVCFFCFPASAHSGGTDSQGGHRDNKNVSGLGSYHYHHGYGPHLHEGGVCPYAQPVYEEPTYSEPESTSNNGLEFASEEDIQMVREVAVEHYEDPNYFDCYDPELDVFFNEPGGVYLDISGGSVNFGLGFGEILSGRGYQFSEEAGIWYNDVGYYYDYSWEYVTWEELEEEMENAGVYICDECENAITDSNEDHREDCSNHPAVIEAREAEEREKEKKEEAVNSLLWFSALAGGGVGISYFVNYLGKRK